MQTERQLRIEIAEIGKKLYNYRYVVATDGNISTRSGTNILITPAGVCKGSMNPDDMILIDKDGRVLRGYSKPSSEFRMHLEIYKNRPDVEAVVHAHPVFATTFALCAIGLDEPVLPEIVLSLKQIPLANYATPGTKEVEQSISQLIKNNNALLLENHGVLTVGENLKRAYMFMEQVEHAAQIIYQAHNLCQPKNLTASQLNSLLTK